MREAAWPLIRGDLGLRYVQIGVLLSLPSFVSNAIEPILGILADTRYRRAIILGGGAVYGAALLLIAGSGSFAVLLLATIALYPASGAFVSLSQATLMDTEPTRHEQNMARWSFAGWVGVVAGPLALSGVALVGGSWRALFVGLGILSVFTLGPAYSRIHPTPTEEVWDWKDGLRGAFQALGSRDVLRWLALLEFSDFLVDVLLGYLALYFVDVARTSSTEAALAVAVWTGAGLVGGLLIIPLLERVEGLRYVRVSAFGALVLFPLFLLVPSVPLKVVLLGLLGLLGTGWYPVLQGRLYSELPGRSGLVLTVSTVFGVAGSGLPLLLGLLAQRVGLQAALWVLLLGPLSLLVGLIGARTRRSRA